MGSKKFPESIPGKAALIVQLNAEASRSGYIHRRDLERRITRVKHALYAQQSALGRVDRCIVCGGSVPEGRQVCPICFEKR